MELGDDFYTQRQAHFMFLPLTAHPFSILPATGFIKRVMVPVILNLHLDINNTSMLTITESDRVDNFRGT